MKADFDRTRGGLLHGRLWPLLMVALAMLATTPAMAQPRLMSLPDIKASIGDFDAMLSRRTVRILVPVSRSTFFVSRGTMLGVEAELGQRFERWLNGRYKNKVYKIHVGLIPVPHDRLMDYLIQGKGDIAAGLLTVTPERKAVVDFAAPWAEDVKEVLVTGPQAPGIASLDELGGQIVRVRKSSSYYSHILAINERLKNAGKPEIRVEPADENLQDEDLLEMVAAGLLPWTVVDRFKAEGWANIFKGITVRDDIAVNEGGHIAWAIRKDSPRLAKELNEFVAGHKIGTAFGNDVRGRYFVGGSTIKNALAAGSADKLNVLLGPFTKFGTTYSIDPFLLAAQGFQESQLVQSLRSKSGAVGIMQIKPSTAREKQIGINDVVTSAHNNIEAGAKYLRYMADKYIPDPDVSPRDRVLMALAAYNVDPGNLKRFRAYAKDNGLNPNVWFGNVEHGAAAIVGYETVQYIGNIYKYYIAYSTLRPS